MTHAEHPAPLLTDRVAVVTGGGGGIGAATARLFARHGARVVIADIDGGLADATTAEIRESGGSAQAVRTDVRDPDEVTRLARSVLDRYGRADVLVNNVGHWLRHPGNFVDTDPRPGMSCTTSICTTFSCSPRPSCRPWSTGTQARS